MRLPINSNWHPISYLFGVIAAYCSKFGHFAFLSPLWGAWCLGTTYVYLGLIGKRVVDFLLVLIELFSLYVYGWVSTSENRSKIGDFAPTPSFWYKISNRRDHLPLIIYARIVRPMNASHFVTDSFHKKKLCIVDFLQAKCDFTPKTAVLRFRAIFGERGLRGNVR